LSRLRTVIVALGAVVVLSATTSSAFAYALGGAAWPGSPILIKYAYANVFDGALKMPNGQPLPNSLIRGSIEKALRLWADAIPVNFIEVPNNGPADLRFRHLYINGPDRPSPADPWAKAQATCLGYGTACEVQYDDGDRWQEVGTIPQPDILGATIHEVGHILGMNHSDVAGANMYWIFHRFSGIDTGQLFPDDIQGIHQIYATASGSVIPMATPEPAALALAFLAAGCWLMRRPRRATP
jgi:hypothetical protein